MATRTTLTEAVCILTLGIATWLPGSAQAAVTWAVNGHSYDAVFSDNPTWFAARDAAAAMTLGGMPGHLATFMTRPEQEFVIAALGGGDRLNAMWLGGYQDTTAPDYSEPYGGWRWITGEPWLGVAASDPVIPRSDFGFNNTYFDRVHSEEYTITWWRTGGINDYYAFPSLAFGDALGGPARGFIVEFETPAVPAPATLVLIGSGLLTVMRRVRRSRA